MKKLKAEGQLDKVIKKGTGINLGKKPSQPPEPWFCGQYHKVWRSW
jgi:hypothetical protein